MELEIKTADGTKVVVNSSEIYEALAKINELIEVAPNRWESVYGTYYVLTKKGFYKIDN